MGWDGKGIKTRSRNWELEKEVILMEKAHGVSMDEMGKNLS